MVSLWWLLVLGCAAILPGGDTAAIGGACRSDADCGAEQYCASAAGTAACGVPPIERCASDADCGSGLTCHTIWDGCSSDQIGSECRPPCDDGGAYPDVCGAGMTCEAGACRPEACADGYACDEEEVCGEVPEGVPVHELHHGCARVACEGDEDCGELLCVEGVCQGEEGVCSEVFTVAR